LRSNREATHSVLVFGEDHGDAEVADERRNRQADELSE